MAVSRFRDKSSKSRPSPKDAASNPAKIFKDSLHNRQKTKEVASDRSSDRPQPRLTDSAGRYKIESILEKLESNTLSNNKEDSKGDCEDALGLSLKGQGRGVIGDEKKEERNGMTGFDSRQSWPSGKMLDRSDSTVSRVRFDVP